MTNRRPPLSLKIQSFLALKFRQYISRAWLSILDGFSCNYLRPHHSGSPLVRNCSSTGGSRSNMWEHFSWGCPPLSAPPWVEIHSPTATGNSGHKFPLWEQVPLTRAQKKLLGVQHLLLLQRLPSMLKSGLWKTSSSQLLQGWFIMIGPWPDFPVPLWEIRAPLHEGIAQMLIVVYVPSQKARCHKAAPQESLVILISIS